MLSSGERLSCGRRSPPSGHPLGRRPFSIFLQRSRSLRFFSPGAGSAASEWLLFSLGVHGTAAGNASTSRSATTAPAEKIREEDRASMRPGSLLPPGAPSHGLWLPRSSLAALRGQKMSPEIGPKANPDASPQPVGPLREHTCLARASRPTRAARPARPPPRAARAHHRALHRSHKCNDGSSVRTAASKPFARAPPSTRASSRATWISSPNAHPKARPAGPPASSIAPRSPP